MPPKSQKEREEKKQDESNKKRSRGDSDVGARHPDKRARLQTILSGAAEYPDSKADETVIYANAPNERLVGETTVEVKPSEHLRSLGLTGQGVFARVLIPKGAIFGYYGGISYDPNQVGWAQHPLFNNPYNMDVRCKSSAACGRTDHPKDAKGNDRGSHNIVVCGDPHIAANVQFATSTRRGNPDFLRSTETLKVDGWF